MMKNSMAGLSDKLQQQLKDDQQAVSNQTLELLKLHASGLQKLSTDALNTTKSAIQRQNQLLNELHSETLQRLRWLMWWPFLASIGLSIAILVGAFTVSWYRVKQADDERIRILQQIYIAQQEFCKSSAGKLSCK